MLFNSYVFILIFLPIVLIGYHLIGQKGYRNATMVWLVLASLFFYGWWNPIYLILILCSIIINFTLGVLLGRSFSQTKKKWILVIGVLLNLGLIGYYKYYNFVIENIAWFFERELQLEVIILPLAISFFTFQQIAYLVDAYKGEVRDYNFLHYCLFVTFFPQLIAGPIVHHKEMLPQFSRDRDYKLEYKNLSIGVTIFAIGLFKKVILADGVAEFASPIFFAAENEEILSFTKAWEGALAYSLQLYFDFSGYSDMAIGVARMFSIILPVNFNSPYKAINIIEFWRSWHITLSRFLRDYIYFPLGGSRKGNVRRYVNLMLTMLLGGLWHGAGWTFIIWGGLHGVFLVINHTWQKVYARMGYEIEKSTWYARGASRFVTFIAVIIGWVFFRALSFNGAMNMIVPMSGANGLPSLPEFVSAITQSGIIIFSLFMALYGPNTQQIMSDFKPVLNMPVNSELKGKFQRKLIWRPSILHGFFISSLLIYSLFRLIRESEFLYFNF